MTFKQATAIHLANLATLGWAVRADLKVPHATAPDGVRLWFKPQAVYASGGTDLGAARSLHVDPRVTLTTDLARHGADLAREQRAGY